MWQRGLKPVEDVFAQVTGLFSSDPSLLEGFKQFLPESTAQAEAELAAARQPRHIPDIIPGPESSDRPVDQSSQSAIHPVFPPSMSAAPPYRSPYRESEPYPYDEKIQKNPS